MEISTSKRITTIQCKLDVFFENEEEINTFRNILRCAEDGMGSVDNPMYEKEKEIIKQLKIKLSDENIY